MRHHGNYFSLPVWLALNVFSLSAHAEEANEVATPTVPTPVYKHRIPQKGDTYVKTKYTSDKSEAEADHRSLLLAAGNDKIIDLDSETNWDPNRTSTVFTGNSTIVTVAMVKLGEAVQLVIKPVGEGDTNVTVRDRTGKIKIILDVTVAKQNLVRYFERLRQNLKEVEGITIGIEDQRVVIRGDVLTTGDYGLIANELSDGAYGNAVINKAVMSNVTLNALAKRIEVDVQSFAPTVNSTVLNGKIILGGSVESEAIKNRALKKAEWYLPDTHIADPVSGLANALKNDKPLQLIQNDIQVTPPPPKRDSKLVRLSVYFVELNKDFLKSFAFKWQPGFTADPSVTLGAGSTGGTTTSTSSGFTFSGTLSSLLPTFSSNPSSATYGRILKSDTIIGKSGKEASLRNVQNLPTQMVGQNGTTGTGASQTVGTSINITPTIMQGQDIELDIGLQQDDYLGPGIGGAAITSTHSVKTNLYLKSGENAAVAAVSGQDTSTSFNRDDPNKTVATGNIKALFNLQRSKNMSKSRNQFVVFVSPQIIESASEGTEDLKRNFRMPSSNH